MKLSILVPIYNERSLVRSVWKTLKGAPIDRCLGISDVEILVVDDGSTDGTRETLEEIAQEPFAFECGLIAQVRLIPHPENRGKGAAIRTAIDHSTGDILIIQDADLEYSPQDYPALLTPIVQNDADAVFGSRFTGHCRRVLYFWHSVMNGFLTLLSNALNDINITDMETGYKAFRGEIGRRLRLTSNRFGIEPELASRIAKARLRLYEVPISYRGRSYQQGKKIGPMDGVAALFQIFWFGLWDTEPFKPGLSQTLTVLEDSAGQIYVPLLGRAMQTVPKKEKLRILEVGAGVGTLTQMLLHRGDVVATDISPEFVERLNQRFDMYEGFEARLWDASQVIETNEKFDLIVAINILEHIDQDSRALAIWRSMLKPGGQVVVLVPNYPAIYSPVDKSVGHFRRYSRAELEQKLLLAGLTPQRTLYGNPLAVIGWALNAWVFGKAEISRFQLWLYSALKPVLRLIEAPLEKLGGLNLVVIAAADAAKQPQEIYLEIPTKQVIPTAP